MGDKYEIFQQSKNCPVARNLFKIIESGSDNVSAHCKVNNLKCKIVYLIIKDIYFA